MSSDLVVNPHSRVEIDSRNSECINITSPKPRESLMTLHVNAAEYPALFGLFSELGPSNLGFLDIRNDLTEADRDLLVKWGFLVERGTEPEMPLFACSLDEIEVGDEEIDRTRLIVNPSFRFNAFDLSKFRTLVEKHLSPHAPSVTITVPEAAIDLTYWISHEHAGEISRFEPGKRLDPSIDNELIRKLAAAEILVAPEWLEEVAVKWQRKLNAVSSKFQESRYAVLPEILPSGQMAAMRRYYRAYVDAGFMPFGDPQVPNRFRQHNEPFAAILHRSLVHIMSVIVGEEVIPSYSYAASYKEGAALKPHTDREQCEFSISFQVDYTPEPSGHLSPWPLYVEPPESPGPLATEEIPDDWYDDYSRQRPGKTGVQLASGDGLIYKGRELVHYRFELPPGHHSTSLFFHYVAKDYSGSLD